MKKLTLFQAALKATLLSFLRDGWKVRKMIIENNLPHYVTSDGKVAYMKPLRICDKWDTKNRRYWKSGVYWSKNEFISEEECLYRWIKQEQ